VCTFIYITLPTRVSQDVLDGLRERHPRISPWPVDNPVMTPHLRPGERCYRATASHCDCDTLLGIRTVARGRKRDPSREVQKLRAKGWGETKITRWLESRQRTKDEHGKRLAGFVDEVGNELEAWIAFLQDALERRSLPWVGVLIHSQPKVESITVAERGVPLASTTRDTLASLPRDVLHRFTAERRTDSPTRHR
jgi:hypothetical protein